jgi:zinc transport system substrate-binding protein
MKKIFPLLFLLLLTLAACSNNQNSADDQTLTVYTTVFPLTSFIEQIAGDTVNVESIYPQGADMHSYEPTQKDMISYSDGDLFLTTSNELDPVASSIAETIKNDTEIIETAADINAEAFLESHHEHGHEEAHSDEEEHDHGTMDPHIWLSPSLASDMALSVKTALTELSPDNADMYNENYEALKADIEQLDEQLTQISSDSVNTDVFISHESIGYLAHQYGFNQVGINGLSNQEPSQQELTEIIDSINAEDIPYILYEPNVTSTVTDVIRSETNAEPLYFNNLESLANNDPEDATYQSMMEKNIESLDKALNNK